MAEHYLEYGGGLGDVLYQCYQGSSYNFLAQMPVGDRATVTLICANPFAYELFHHHPRRRDIDIQDFGYWDVAEDAAMRRERGLPARNSFVMPSGTGKLMFYPPAEDIARLIEVERQAGTVGYAVLAAAAGLPDRNLPPEIVQRAVDYLVSAGYLVVATGRSFERHGRSEVPVPEHPRVLNLIDKLTVPGTALLVRNCAGLVTCHSALNLLGWLEDKPQLLAYPTSVYERHFRRRDQWSFGADREETVHCTFDQFTTSHLKRFAAVL